MGRAFATGKKAPGICDRCGWTWKLSKLKNEIVNLNRTNLLVCPDCWDPDHPQNLAGRIDYTDAQALRNPRVDQDTGVDPASTALDYDAMAGWSPIVGTTLSAGTDGNVTYTRMSRTDNNLGGVFIAPDPFFSPDDYRYLRIRLRLESELTPEDWTGLFYWRRGGDGSINNQTTTTERPYFEQMGEDWHIITYPLYKEAKWAGGNDIQLMQWVPYKSKAMAVHVDYIRLEPF
jgi:hypothetical protein